MIEAACPDSARSCASNTEEALLQVFRRAATEVPSYRHVLLERGVRVEDVTDLASFSRLCPVLSKETTFDRFPIEELSVGARTHDLAAVLTSSGQGGRFSFGVTTRTAAEATVRFLDDALDRAFHVKSRSTLAINCLPMGVGFSSRHMTVATVSVREDMALALVTAFGHRYDQILLVGDPMFLKHLTDRATELALDWNRHRVHVVIGEEIFGEHYRGYLASRLGIDLETGEQGTILSSFGVGELGLHLAYETTATVGLRRAATGDREFACELFGSDLATGALPPMLFAFDAERLFVEILDADEHGYGLMTTSLLDPEQTIPLIRYQTGDIAALLDRDRICELARQRRVPLSRDLPPMLLALRGRRSEGLPNGSHVGVYKDALYADHGIADCVTGATRLVFEGACCTWHVQLRESATADSSVRERLLHALPKAVRPLDVVLWAYSQFPFGMSLDYERKFCHFRATDTAALRH
jgi:phenylacetate-coenzyme A ligase PaaK-like adenylate-forming protein